MAEQNGNGSNLKPGGLICPCCGSGLFLKHDGGSARLEIDTPAREIPAAAGRMFIDPHAHMISRTTDDYEALARAGGLGAAPDPADEAEAAADRPLDRRLIELVIVGHHQRGAAAAIGSTASSRRADWSR